MCYLSETITVVAACLNVLRRFFVIEFFALGKGDERRFSSRLTLSADRGLESSSFASLMSFTVLVCLDLYMEGPRLLVCVL